MKKALFCLLFVWYFTLEHDIGIPGVKARYLIGPFQSKEACEEELLGATLNMMFRPGFKADKECTDKRDA